MWTNCHLYPGGVQGAEMWEPPEVPPRGAIQQHLKAQAGCQEPSLKGERFLGVWSGQPAVLG